MQSQKFSIKKRLESFKYAFNGLKILVLEEHNARIHLFAAMCAILLGIYFNISAVEWILVCFAIGFVISCEAINSAIENLADFVSSDKNELIKKAKDLSAAGVLVGAIMALICGIVIFLPKIIERVK